MNAPTPDDPYASLHWIERDGVRQAVVPLFGARPEWIRDDDVVRFWWDGEWLNPSHGKGVWATHPAVILRHRDHKEDKA